MATPTSPTGRDQEVETVKIPPSPRILKVLAEIDFTPWQCLAELIDNSFDEFQDAAREGAHDGGALRVELPGNAADKLCVIDDGRGMSLERITDAVRAGFSGNDPFSKLGLFGMGFNVATARLGDVTTFLSTRAGDSEWVGVQIDLGAMPEDFSVPVVHRPKTEPSHHGTRIEIARLNEAGRYFTRAHNRTRVRAQLGGIYSHLIGDRGYTLTVDEIEVKPWRHCVWSAQRSVPYRGTDVVAVVKIDEPLTPVSACRTCGTWQEELDAETCERCGSKDLVERERRVHGWLGIARELSSKEYGIDFLRNGRKILRFDKSLFMWSDPDDPSGASQVEYPIEIPANLGRIVGEIHVDHAPVLYTKDG
ncbi:MAG TPA: ATP-binding protein, partial [Solirubrobacteraceae bacterium]